MPSLTAMVVNSSGNPPAWRTPSLALIARRARGRLQGVTSFQDDATPIWGFDQSASVMPTARSMARAPARVLPSVTSNDLGFSGLDMPERLGAHHLGAWPDGSTPPVGPGPDHVP